MSTTRLFWRPHHHMPFEVKATFPLGCTLPLHAGLFLASKHIASTQPQHQKLTLSLNSNSKNEKILKSSPFLLFTIDRILYSCFLLFSLLTLSLPFTSPHTPITKVDYFYYFYLLTASYFIPLYLRHITCI
ncbi:hypothetical protein BKA57DRAFT_450720, partial [Linnemannia elongata]